MSFHNQPKPDSVDLHLEAIRKALFAGMPVSRLYSLVGDTINSWQDANGYEDKNHPSDLLLVTISVLKGEW